MDGSSTRDTQARIADGSDTVPAGSEQTSGTIGDTVQELAAKADVRTRAKHEAPGHPARLPDVTRTAAGQAASLARKYPVRLVTVVGAALAGIIAGRRRRLR